MVKIIIANNNDIFYHKEEWMTIGYIALNYSTK